MERDLRAAISRLYNDHSIVQPTDAQHRLVTAVETLQARGELTKVAVLAIAAKMPARFLKDNQFDSELQYGELLWEAVSTASPREHVAGSTNTTHFHAPVQAGVLQTAPGSAAHWVGNQQTLGESFTRALAEAKVAAQNELTDETKRDQGLAIIDAVAIEAQKAEPDKSKIVRLLKPMLKWSGERFTKAVDTAIEVATKASLGQPLG